MLATNTMTPRGSTGSSEPERRCIVTGAPGPRAELIRLVVGPQRQIVPDITESLPGRGLWLSASRDIVRAACDRKAFAKAARADVSVPAGLADVLEVQLTERCIDLVSMARRAGLVAAGYQGVRDAMKRGDVALLFTARDSDGSDAVKLARLAPETTRVTLLDAAELGRAVGREMVVHVALAAGRLTERLERETRRLAGFRNGSLGVDTPGD